MIKIFSDITSGSNDEPYYLLHSCKKLGRSLESLWRKGPTLIPYIGLLLLLPYVGLSSTLIPYIGISPTLIPYAGLSPTRIPYAGLLSTHIPLAGLSSTVIPYICLFTLITYLGLSSTLKPLCWSLAYSYTLIWSLIYSYTLCSSLTYSYTLCWSLTYSYTLYWSLNYSYTLSWSLIYSYTFMLVSRLLNFDLLETYFLSKIMEKRYKVLGPCWPAQSNFRTACLSFSWLHAYHIRCYLILLSHIFIM